jgi:trans-2,3-dihydro-3-hydroxyanthranilate isomerase
LKFKMIRATYYILDVFAENNYQGNQLAVFTDLKNIADAEMQHIAREMNFSETTFVLGRSGPENIFKVRIFTPRQEVPFAGHPTLGTSWLIREKLINEPVDNLALDLKAGRIPVTFSDNNRVWMRQLEPTFGNIFSGQSISEILNIDEDEIDTRFPVQEVSTGLPVVIVPVKKLHSVKRIKINRTKYFEFVEKIEAKPILVFCSETYNKANQLNVRCFVDYYGIPEDPATGSANGCLAGYLVKHSYFSAKKIDITCEQGFEIHRPSILYLRASVEDDTIKVNVGGKVQLIASGTWY